jgi:polyferredoxin
MTKFNKNRNYYKNIFQSLVILILAFMGIKILFDPSYTADFELFCPFGGIQAISTFLTRNSLACSMSSSQIMMGIVLIIGIIIFSKLFCGYICPLGTISEWLGKFGEKFKIRITLAGITDNILRLLKYILLFIVFFFTLQSSELFCKKFDPYYAITSGFNQDVNVLFATVAIFLLVLGSIFFRLFWCKYLCPLGAASNIFKFWWWIGGVLIIYIIILKIGIDLSYVVPLAVIIIGGYILEIWRMEKVKPSLVKITRNQNSCINCKLCSKKCPQGIDVAVMDSVTHIDCTLCGDCISSCPEDNTLQINKRNLRWLPTLAIVILISLGLISAKLFEIPTINLKWGSEEQLSSAGIFHQAGLKNIKCYGSATAFANQIQNIEGIYGVTVYAGSHSVKIYYDKQKWNDNKLQQLIFTPVKRVIKTIDKSIDSVYRVTVTVDHFFDPLDVFYLQQLLSQKSSACGFETEYSCPIIIHLYFPEGEVPTYDELKSIIEARQLSFKNNGVENHVKLNYKVVSFIDQNKLSRMEYAKVMYNKLNYKFNKFSSYSDDVLKECILSMNENYKLRNQYSYLVSHLSNDKGIVGFETWLDDQGSEMAKIIFVDTITSIQKINQAINADTLNVNMKSGDVKRIKNNFKFKPIEVEKSYKKE